MAIRSIAKMGHPILSKVASPVENPSDAEIARLAADMLETLEAIGASGIAAPQVFEPLRVVVYRIAAARIPVGSDLEPVPWTVMVNPEITPLVETKVEVWERCLSISGLHGKVPRWPRISIRYKTLDGDTVEHEARGSWSSLLQHECDHLDGILYPMRMADMTKLAFDDAPGVLAREAAAGESPIDPLFLDLVARWPARDRWVGEAGSA